MSSEDEKAAKTAYVEHHGGCPNGGRGDNFLAGFHSGIQHERKKHEWVSVKERLPEYGVSVLAYSSEFGMIIDQLFEAGDWKDRWLQGYRSHWMSLPLPPKEQKE